MIHISLKILWPCLSTREGVKRPCSHLTLRMFYFQNEGGKTGTKGYSIVSITGIKRERGKEELHCKKPHISLTGNLFHSYYELDLFSSPSDNEYRDLEFLKIKDKDIC